MKVNILFLILALLVSACFSLSIRNKLEVEKKVAAKVGLNSVKTGFKAYSKWAVKNPVKNLVAGTLAWDGIDKLIPYKKLGLA